MFAYIKVLVVGLSIITMLDSSGCKSNSSQEPTKSMRATQAEAIAKNQVNTAAALKIDSNPSMPPLPVIRGASQASSPSQPAH